MEALRGCNTSIQTTSFGGQISTFGAQRGAASDQRSRDDFTENGRKDVSEKFDDVESSDAGSVYSQSRNRPVSRKNQVSRMVLRSQSHNLTSLIEDVTRDRNHEVSRRLKTAQSNRTGDETDTCGEYSESDSHTFRKEKNSMWRSFGDYPTRTG